MDFENSTTPKSGSSKKLVLTEKMIVEGDFRSGSKQDELSISDDDEGYR